MKKLLAGFVILSVVLSGCTGSFNLTRKVYDLHRSQENKWVDELIFVGVVIIPVYGLATLGDAVIFNSIEFWSGKNPITLSRNDMPAETIRFETTNSGVVARNESGAVLGSTHHDPEGGISVYDGENNLVRHFSSEEVALIQEQALLN